LAARRCSARAHEWGVGLRTTRYDRTPARSSVLDWIFQDEFLTIDLEPFLRKTWGRLRRLDQARAMVVTSPDVLSGTPVIRGTRVPVYDVAASVASGIPIDRVLAAYPSLDADKVDLAVIYAEANPPRGRPRQSAEPQESAVVIADRRLSRRRKAE
jgi:uncharacterized protein (DUF433 family)